MSEIATLDLRGLRCPLPVLKAAKAVKLAAPGALVEVLADDPLAPADFADFCAAKGHQLVASDETAPGVFRFLIRRVA
ncbi:MAG: sulfurtransferase TusA family protein [Hyphomicrobiales bacterium]|nr:sulfurtransferase TusA family protein [Hyphomicrobiales bacterium]